MRFYFGLGFRFVVWFGFGVTFAGLFAGRVVWVMCCNLVLFGFDWCCGRFPCFWGWVWCVFGGLDLIGLVWFRLFALLVGLGLECFIAVILLF